ncbi:response regulator [Methanocalculus sp.]|uniref:hybrid sensor histidine kinase/response regulator n=1 Tax=Methanocalculus sp. TaxID=2004547 RepID=UPI00271645BA|nr:response regulator [Methanocalculus sp.]MDO8841785.1 PAS domain S-box protein [Methanocalculus sp.]
MHILHVDDEPLFLELTKIYLERNAGVKVTHCTSAAEALDLVESIEFDAIISDYEMPGMNGIELLFELRSADITTPFIIFTGRSRQDVVIEALNKGADLYIQKGGDARSQFAELGNAVARAVLKYRFETETHESKRRIADIFHHLPDATFAIDCSGRVIAWNRAMEKMTGVKAGTIIGNGDQSYSVPFYGVARPTLVDYILHPDDEIPLSYLLLRRDQGEIIVETETATLRGEPVVLWAKATLLYDKNGEITGAIESVRDITAQKKAEKALIAADEYRRTLIEAHIDPLVTIAADGRIEDVNAATEVLTGRTRDELIGTGFCSLFTDPVSAEGICRRAFAGETAREHPLHVRNADGEIQLVIFYGTLYRGRDGVVRGVFAELHEPVPCSCKDGGCACSGEDQSASTIHLDIISHDLANALSTASGYADLLNGMVDGEAGRIADAITLTLRRGQEVIRRINSVRRFGMIRNGSAGIRFIPLDRVIKNEILHFPGISIVYEGTESIVLADDLVGEILWNLLDNSVRHGGSGVSIRIVVWEEGDSVTVSVEDTGPGIPLGKRSTVVSGGEGHGLGIIRELVTRYGGDFSISDRVSGKPGEGANIRFSLRNAYGEDGTIRSDDGARVLEVQGSTSLSGGAE